MVLTQCTSISELLVHFFTTFWESGEKDHPKVRVYREKFNIDFFAPIFFGSLYICGGAHISSRDFKTHRDGHNHRHPGPADISKFDQNSENNFFQIEIVKDKFRKKHMSKQTYTQPHFWKEWNFNYLFCIFLKQLLVYTIASTAKFYYRIVFFGNFPETLGMSRSLENCKTTRKLHPVVCGSDCINYFLKPGFWQYCHFTI